jgi:demethylmenaquinone methyltransferase/2-methoxy-6-polyprenyl-1,4-benzoquinol methylase
MKNTLPPTEQKAEFVKQGFNEIAARYDLLNDVMTLGLHRHWKAEAIERLNLQPGMHLLDLCAGTGDLSFRAAARLNHDCEIVALDFSSDMMAQGRQRMESQEGRECIQWLCADAESLPFQEQSFDGAVVGFGLRNVTHLDTTLAEVLRVLKPGAMFVSLDTAAAEWKALQPFYQVHMRIVVPLLGALLARSRQMYSYLTASAETFSTPPDLARHLEQAGFHETGYTYRPRFIGGAALVWGKRP